MTDRTRLGFVHMILYMLFSSSSLLYTHAVFAAKQINRPVREVEENEHEGEGNAREDVNSRATLGMTGEPVSRLVPAARFRRHRRRRGQSCRGRSRCCDRRRGRRGTRQSARRRAQGRCRGGRRGPSRRRRRRSRRAPVRVMSRCSHRRASAGDAVFVVQQRERRRWRTIRITLMTM